MKQEVIPQGLLEALQQDAESFLLSPKEVSDRLSEIASTSFAKRLAIRITDHNESYIWGEAQHANLTIVQSGPIAGGVNFEVLAEIPPVASADQALLAYFSKIAEALWGNDLRSMGALLWKRQAIETRLVPSLARLATGLTDKRLGIVFVDLDNFKSLNDQTNHEEGDRALRAVNRQLHDMTRHFGGLAFNPSGDEFHLILPYGDVLQLLSAFRGMRAAVRETRYGETWQKDIRVDLTIGVSPTEQYGSLSDVSAAVAAAEALTKAANANGVQTKRRGKITLAGTGNRSSRICTATELLQLGVILVRRRLLSTPFADPRLNLVSLLASESAEAGFTSLSDDIKSLLDWLNMTITGECREDSLLSALGPSDVPAVAVALAVAHGLTSRQFKAEDSAADWPGPGKAFDIAYAHDGSRAAVLSAGKVLWGEHQENDRMIEVVALQNASALPLHYVVGVQVGLSELPVSFTGTVLPDDLFDQLILVDERPVSGGGLPDFWQPAIAQVCSALGRHGGDAHVMVWGATASTSETYLRLSGQKAWSIDEVSRVAELSSDKTRVLRQDIEKNLKLVDRPETLVTMLLSAIPKTYGLSKKETAQPDALRLPQGDALVRPMLSRDRLPLEDGVRCRDAAQAYPIVIDVLRKGVQVRTSCDDAKQELRELLGFKLIVEQPLKDKIPAYLRDHSEDLADYADRVLLKPNSLFRKSLDETGQLTSVINHLAGYLRSPPPALSTRRACLVVPHEVAQTGEPRPMGLLSVWASPRVTETERHLVDFVFVWRTVEAFIGLPYSLYGSTRLAEYLIAQVVNAVSTTSNLKAPAVGELTYIALSLHMRVDEFHKRIAKRIVDDSSD